MTEASHLRTLRVLDLIFYQRMKKEGLLPREELARLFPNLPELIEIHSEEPPACPHPPPSASLDTSEDLVPQSAVGSGKSWSLWDAQVTGTTWYLEFPISISCGVTTCALPNMEGVARISSILDPLDEEVTKPDMKASGSCD